MSSRPETVDSTTDSAPAWQARVLDRSLKSASDRAVQRGRALVAAAGRLVARSGADDLTMQKVATEAGLSLRVLYRHFEGKDDLLVALIEEAQVVLARLLQHHAARGHDALERLGAALYFAADSRQHTDAAYNRALATFAARTAITAPERLARARRPLVVVVENLITEAMTAGLIEVGDPQQATGGVLRSYVAYELTLHLGNSVGPSLPSPEQFVRSCLAGLGARLPQGWEARLTLDDEEAERSGRESIRRAGTHADVAVDTASAVRREA